MSHLIYLASPYSHADASVRQDRYVAVCKAASRLMVESGAVVFSPIAHSHPIAELGGLDGMNHEFWMHQCLPMVERSDELVILAIDGWDRSRGVAAERQQAQLCNIPIRLIEP